MPNITKSYVDGLKCRATAYIKWDTKVPGFGVRVYASKQKGKCTKSFVLRYSNKAGKRRMETLGVYGPMTPAQARERAEQRVVETRDGIDPLEEKKNKRLAVTPEAATFGQVARRIAGREPESSKKVTATNIKRRLDEFHPGWSN